MRTSRFVKYAWVVVAYTILVILWGAVVRATGSGAGCGNYWPVCNGEVIPRAESVETLIEFSHRLTSAFAGLLVLILLVWAFRLKPALKFVRRMAIMSFVFILIEGGLGAMLVRLELVEDNASTLRAVVIALHLVNTLILLLWLSLTAWGAWVQREDGLRVLADARMRLLTVVALIGFSIMSAMGAVTALGDTLFLSGVIGNEPDGAQHFLISLRAWHPILAIIISVFLLGLGYWLLRRKTSPVLENLTRSMMLLVTLQVGVGVLNIFLQAPVWMQVTHLLIADTLWIVLVIMTAEIWTTDLQYAEEPNSAQVSDGDLAIGIGD